MMIRHLAAFAIALLFALPAFAQPVEYAYTPIDLDKCRHTPGKEVEDYGSWRCKGYAGIAVHVAGGDQRSYVSFGPRAADEPAARQTLAAFNAEGKIIEWRIASVPGGNKQAFATIVRWHTTVSDDDKQIEGQVLVVTRLGPGGVCHVGYVDGRANPDANDLARKLADERARGFRCGTDKAVVLGKTGPGFSGPYGED